MVAGSDGLGMIAAVPVAKVRSSKREPGRVEAPPERIEEDSVAGDKCIRIKPGVPIPSVAIPDGRSKAACARVSPRRIHVGFGQIRGPQASPPVEIVRVRGLVELLRLQLSSGVQTKLVAALHFNLVTA